VPGDNFIGHFFVLGLKIFSPNGFILNLSMKFLFSILMMVGIADSAFAQQQKTQPLPMPYYIKMMDSTSSIDVVFMQGSGGSISLEGRNAKLFNNYFERETTVKLNTPQAGTIMWQINGREFLSGSIYLGDTTGCVVITKNGREYVNRISPQGNSFFKTQGKKQ
jgi:hypothetical protein